MEFKKTNNKKQDCKAFGLKHSKAQHLVELVLFFPFLVGIIGILTEIGYGLSTSIELNSALNNAVSIVSSKQRWADNAAKETIEDEIYDTTLEIQGFYVNIASYDYTYAFKLVNLFFNAIPEKFHFKSIVVTNKSLFLPNNYNVYDNDLGVDFEFYYAQEGNQNETP